MLASTAVALFSRRLPHVFPRAALARVLAPTYAKAAQVDPEEAEDRLLRAFASQRVLDQVYQGLSAGVQARSRKVRAAELTPAVSAVLVLVNVEVGQASEMMREAIQGGKGQALLQEGLKALGAHLVKELIR